nr:D-alanyl-D-alanine carboxypeptidase/D-alanyl-D-alanine-endopeptidase [Phaeobacter marinintestinus]
MFTRRLFLGGVAATALNSAALANAPVASLRPQLRGADFARRAGGGADGLIARFGLPGEVACAVADVTSGLQLEAVNGETGMPPASVAKALTALYALDAMGPGHRFRTRLLTRGAIANGVLNGDLILAGGADPTLDTDALAGLAAALKAAGVREVRGAFEVYDGMLPYVKTIDTDQPDHLAYSPAVSGIGLNFNRVHFEWKLTANGYVATMDGRTAKYRPAVSMAKMRIVRRNLPVYAYSDQNGVDQWSVASSALGKGGVRTLPVRKPALYAGDVFRTLARSNGIVLKQAKVIHRLPPGARTIASHDSGRLDDILKAMLKYSNNLTAETVGMAASVARGHRPGSLRESAAEMSRWAAMALGMMNTKLVDHSGLGSASRMPPSDLVGALVKVRQEENLRHLLKPFLMRDSQGRVNKAHPIKVDAKTGTLNFVSGLGGYMTAADGTELAFAIFAADEGRRARIKKADRERPQGGAHWNRQAKKLQQKLIERWGSLYGS